MPRVLMLAILVAAPVGAQVQQSNTAGSIAAAPLQDANIKARKIPPVLQQAAQDPYSSAGTRTCAAISGAIASLNAVLGSDFDSPSSGQRHKAGVGGVARMVVQSVIPFRGVIREVTGANASDRRYATAVDAGIARRGFLHGIARARGCSIG